MLSIFQRVNKIFLKKDKKNLYKVIVLKSILGIFEVVSVISFVPFFYFISDKNFLIENLYVQKFNNYLNLNNAQLTVLVTILPIFTLLFLNFYRLYSNWVEAKTINNLWRSFHSNLFNYYLSKPYLYHVENGSNVLLNNFISRANDALTGLMIPSYLLIGSLITSSTIIFAIILYNPMVSFISILFIILFYFSLFRFLKKKVDQFSVFSPIFSQRTFKIVEESLKSIKSIKISGNKKFFHNQFDNNAITYAKNSTSVQFFSTTPKAAIEIFAYLLIFFLTFFYMYMIDKNISKIIVVISVYLITLQKLIPIINDLFTKYYSILQNKNKFELIREDLKESELLSIEKKQNEDHLNKINFKKNILAEKIIFSYDQKNLFTLTVDKLKIEKGEILGITGESGSGKSTFLNILTGLINSSQGSITVDNTTIKDKYLTKSYQNLIGYLPQNIFILNDSIKKNIAFGEDEKNIDMERVKAVTKLACIDDYIENHLPNKYETDVGENAIKLSGGQRQRIGIARLLYSNKEIMIFDEATNSLDEDTEVKIISNILSQKDKTIILVTHNLKLLKKIKRVIHFQNGRLFEKNS